MNGRVLALDPSVTTCGVAIPGDGGFTVRAYWSQEDAEIRAGLVRRHHRITRGTNDDQHRHRRT